MMPLIPFPNIPNVPGVPAIPRSASFPPAVQVGIAAVAGALWRAVSAGTRWGIFTAAGAPLADSSSFADIIGGAVLSTGGLDYSKDTKVSDFPVERGAFANYNKVETPSEPTVTMCFTGSESERKSFLDTIDAACKSTELYSVVTPEVTYVEYNIQRYSYSRRQQRGATLLIVDISLKEIRQVSAQYATAVRSVVSSPKATDAVPSVDGGKVQAKTPRISVLKSVDTKIRGLF